MNSSIGRGLFSLLIGFLIVACHSSATKSDQDNSCARSYDAMGVIQHISSDRHLVTIHHQAIPGYIMEMTMDFPVHDEHLLDGLEEGDQINFTLKVANDDAWVAGISRTGHTDQPTSGVSMNDGATTNFKPGDAIPDAGFMAEDGRQIHLSDYRGKVVVFTFFFTRCPLPNYCPLMNKNFAHTRNLLLSDPHAPKNWQFLSISFDPDFDKGQTLSYYGDFYRNHNSDRWLFVAATPETLAHFAAPLGLMIMRQDNNISHNLRTVVLDPQGRLYHQFNDNLWTAEQLAQTIKDAASGSPGK
jgi:protein SCO1/2